MVLLHLEMRQKQLTIMESAEKDFPSSPLSLDSRKERCRCAFRQGSKRQVVRTVGERPSVLHDECGFSGFYKTRICWNLVNLFPNWGVSSFQSFLVTNTDRHGVNTGCFCLHKEQSSKKMEYLSQ